MLHKLTINDWRTYFGEDLRDGQKMYANLFEILDTDEDASQ